MKYSGVVLQKIKGTVLGIVMCSLDELQMWESKWDVILLTESQRGRWEWGGVKVWANESLSLDFMSPSCLVNYSLATSCIEGKLQLLSKKNVLKKRKIQILNFCSLLFLSDM